MVHARAFVRLSLSDSNLHLGYLPDSHWELGCSLELGGCWDLILSPQIYMITKKLLLYFPAVFSWDFWAFCIAQIKNQQILRGEIAVAFQAHSFEILPLPTWPLTALATPNSYFASSSLWSSKALLFIWILVAFFCPVQPHTLCVKNQQMSSEEWNGWVLLSELPFGSLSTGHLSQLLSNALW